MTDKTKRLLAEALKLPPEARAAVAGRLIDSLDGRIDEDAEAAWAREIEKRLHDIDSGKVKTVSWARARRTILGRSNGRS